MITMLVQLEKLMMPTAVAQEVFSKMQTTMASVMLLINAQVLMTTSTLTMTTLLMAVIIAVQSVKLVMMVMPAPLMIV